MQPVLVIALLGTTLFAHLAESQNSQQDTASGAAGSSAESRRRKPDFFEGGPKALNESRRIEGQRKLKAEAAGESKPSAPQPEQQTPAPAALPFVQGVPPGPAQKNLTGQEFGLVQTGSTEKDLLAILGPPSSRVVVPDDDGHLRESFQYWVKGVPMATIRLDNGRVVHVETKPK
jgi:hypothetical protein